jgi:HSP20 family molecular chaperone IbpA
MGSRAIQAIQYPPKRAVTIDRLFQAAFHSPSTVYERESLCGWRPLHAGVPRRKNRQPPNSDPGIQIHETAERFVIEVELPRIKADSLYIEITGDLLIIRGERDLKAKANGWQGAPRNAGPMVHRYIQLPVTARPGEVQARLEGNTVKVNIIKRPVYH